MLILQLINLTINALDNSTHSFLTNIIQSGFYGYNIRGQYSLCRDCDIFNT